MFTFVRYVYDLLIYLCINMLFKLMYLWFYFGFQCSYSPCHLSQSTHETNKINISSMLFDY